MTKFTAIVCDRCDVRDIFDRPPINNVKTIDITIEGNAITVELCQKCLSRLKEEVARLTTQQPREGVKAP